MKPAVHEMAAVQANAVTQARSGSLAALFAGHVLQDGEVILLILKPSLWFIILSALRFVAVVIILMIAATLLDQQIPGPNRPLQELGSLVIAGRMMWAVLQWMGRLYVLTDLRIVRLSGVFSVNIFDCPLRKVAHTRRVHSMRERITSTGTIEIDSSLEGCGIGYWNTIARPVEVHETIVAAINRANS